MDGKKGGRAMEMELKPDYRGKLITFVAVREKQLARAEKPASELQAEGWQLCPVAEISQCEHEKVLFLFPENSLLNSRLPSCAA